MSIYQSGLIPPNKTSIKLKPSIITNNNFDKKFNSLSNLPIFVRASREFIDILVSLPKKIIII